jgi:hypothetical protein
MTTPYLHPGPKRLCAALVMAGFSLDPDHEPSRWGSQVRTMLGIAYAESSGNAWLLHHNKNSSGKVTSTDYGNWQINDFFEGPLLWFHATGELIRTTDYSRAVGLFHAGLRELGWSWESYIHNAQMAKWTYDAWYEPHDKYRPWVAYRTNALDNPNRVPWESLDAGIKAFLHERDNLGYPLGRIASTYLEGLTASPPKPLTR